MIYAEHKRQLWRVSTLIFAVGVAFLVRSLVYPDAMSPDVYGAKAYAVPAEIWSLGFMSASGLVIYGLHINGRMPRVTPLLRLAGLTFLVGQFGFLAWSAFHAKGGEAVTLFSVLFFIPLLGHFSQVEARQLLMRWRLARNVAR